MKSVEGGIELSTGDGSLDSHTLKFLEDVLTDLGQDHSLGEALEDIVSDAINDLGDEAIESIRQTGLWVDNPSDDLPLQLDYEDVVDLHTQLVRYEYDPWLDNSELARLFQEKFISDSNDAHILDPENYSWWSLNDIEDANQGSVFQQQLTAIFPIVLVKIMRRL